MNKIPENNLITEDGFYTGGIPSEPDARDYSFIGGASVPFDWDKGFDIETLIGKVPVKDQAQSSSCGGQAWASLSYVLDESNREEKSAKYIYCQTHVGTGGSAGRTNSALCRTQGVSKEVLCPSYPATEAFMTSDDRTTQALIDALTNKEKYYATVRTNFEEIAQAIRDNHGVILGICGQNNGTWRTTYPLPPTSSDVWRHWVYAGKAKIINGKKYIGFLNSWGTEVGDNGWQYIGEEYFTSPYGMFEAWMMTYDPQTLSIPTVSMQLLKMGSRGDFVKKLQTLLGVKSDGIFGKNTMNAVRLFQEKHGLTNDGICGPKTWAALLTKI
jgi:peptidoglycan hydrolase-like protein with peptidoglycan-binding domain